MSETDPTQQVTDPNTGGGNVSTEPGTTQEPTEAQRLQAEIDRLKDEARREADRLRNEAGQANRKLREYEEANQTELQRLQARAKRAEELEPEVETLKQRAETAEAALAAEVEAQQKALPKEMLDLLPAGNPAEQLAWIRKAKDAAAKLKPASTLPPAGQRNPPAGNGKAEPSDTERQAAAASYTRGW